MEGLKTEFKKLVVSQKLSQELVELGIHRHSALNWYDTSEDRISPDPIWEVGNLTNPSENSWPAWTMEELRIMVGNKFISPDLPEPRPRPNDGEETTFFLYTAQKMYEFKSGAEATGTMLKMLLKHKYLTAEEANKRYIDKFKPE